MEYFFIKILAKKTVVESFLGSAGRVSIERFDWHDTKRKIARRACRGGGL
jgi:hypothetical protein